MKRISMFFDKNEIKKVKEILCLLTKNESLILCDFDLSLQYYCMLKNSMVHINKYRETMLLKASGKEDIIETELNDYIIINEANSWVQKLCDRIVCPRNEFDNLKKG